MTGGGAQVRGSRTRGLGQGGRVARGWGAQVTELRWYEEDGGAGRRRRPESVRIVLKEGGRGIA